MERLNGQLLSPAPQYIVLNNMFNWLCFHFMYFTTDLLWHEHNENKFTLHNVFR